MPTPTFIQEADGQNGGTGNVVTFTFGSANTAGNFIVLQLDDSGATPTSIVDTANNTYHLAVNDGTGIQIYYAYNIAAQASNLVTITWSGSNFYNACGCEYSGVQGTSDPLDKTGTANGTGTTASSPTVTTTGTNELIVGCFNVQSGGATAAGGFTQRFSFNFGQCMYEDIVLASPGPIAATATLSSQGWHAAIATFLSGSPPNPPPAAPPNVLGRVVAHGRRRIVGRTGN